MSTDRGPISLLLELTSQTSEFTVLIRLASVQTNFAVSQSAHEVKSGAKGHLRSQSHKLVGTSRALKSCESTQHLTQRLLC